MFPRLASLIFFFTISHVFHPYLSYFLPPPSPNKLYSTKQLTVFYMKTTD